MPTLSRTSEMLDDLLRSKRRVNAEEAEEALAAYLSSFRDPDAQAHALDELSKAVVRLGRPSPSLLLLMEAIDREWERLTGVPV